MSEEDKQKQRKKSVGTLEDFFKRKRGDKDKETSPEVDPEAFKRSRVTQRSPVAQDKVNTGLSVNTSEEENMEKLYKMIEEMGKEMKEIKTEIQSSRSEVNDTIKKLGEDIRSIKEELIKKEVEWKKEKMEIYREVQDLKTRLEKQEKDNKRNNIIIKGLEIKNPKMAGTEVENFIQNSLQVSVKVRNAFTIGKQEEKKVTVAEISTFTEKLAIMKNKARLKGNNIYIEDDLTKEEQQIQTAIKKVAREEREKGKKTQIGYRKLKVNNVQYEWSNEEGGSLKMKEEQPEKK